MAIAAESPVHTGLLGGKLTEMMGTLPILSPEWMSPEDFLSLLFPSRTAIFTAQLPARKNSQDTYPETENRVRTM